MTQYQETAIGMQAKPKRSVPRTGFSAALSDVSGAFRKIRLATTFGWQDVAQRYRRSRVGAFWLTLNMAILIAALGLIFGTLFQTPMAEFLPHLCAGLIVWGYISSCLSEGCTSFISSSGIILQVKMPLFTHILRVLWRNAVILAHNVLIFPFLLVVVGGTFSWHVILTIPGLMLISINLAWIMLLLATICARFRDMTQVVQNILQVLFYLTPIMWMPKTLPSTVSGLIMTLNPFYHMVEVVRAPLQGGLPTALNWEVLVATAVLGWVAALAFFGKYRWRVAYWL